MTLLNVLFYRIVGSFLMTSRRHGKETKSQLTLLRISSRSCCRVLVSTHANLLVGFARLLLSPSFWIIRPYPSDHRQIALTTSSSYVTFKYLCFSSSLKSSFDIYFISGSPIKYVKFRLIKLSNWANRGLTWKNSPTSSLSSITSPISKFGF